jgi:hypothetical protein
MLAGAAVAAKHPPAFIVRQGGFAATLTCLATAVPCRPDNSAEHRLALSLGIARAIQDHIAWRTFQVHVNMVNHASDGTYAATGWITAPPEGTLIWRGRERFAAHLERKCDAPGCWVVKGVTLNGRTLKITAAQ